jgi:hypothetical protein
MRHTLDALQSAVLVVHTLGDDAAVWEDFLDARTIRLRRLYHESLQLTKHAKALTAKQAQLDLLLREHKLATQVILESWHKPAKDDWGWKVKLLRELTRRHYKPWTLDACKEVVNAALNEVNAFQWSSDKQTSGISFLGWRENRRVDHARGAFQFQFHKTFRGFDVADYVNTAWDAYTDAESPVCNGERK